MSQTILCNPFIYPTNSQLNCFKILKFTLIYTINAPTCFGLTKQSSGAYSICFAKLDVHGSVHRNINLIERTKKMQPCSRIYYSNVS
jgi:hypothetical protein